MKKHKLFCFIIIVSPCLSLFTSFADEFENSQTLYSNSNEAASETATLSTTDSAAVTDGIKEFQQYINTNLPATYLGAALNVDGSCNSATKTAAIKLVQYRLNQRGAGLSIDGGFGTLSQSAFSEYVGTIERYQQGDWVYILQGLLYCHGYDPNGFDGYYGTYGGTGCFNAVNNFKRDNVISEGEEDSGTVGIKTIKCLLWRSDTRILPDGMFYLKNAYSSKYLNVQSSTPKTGDYLTQASKLTGDSNLRQLWKITYVGDGYYSLRPMQEITLALTYYSNGNAGLFDITLVDDLTTVINGSRWKLVETSNGGYNILWYGYSNKAVSLASNTTDENASVVIADAQGEGRACWILEKKDMVDVLSKIYIEGSFKEYFSDSIASTSKSMYTTASIPFEEFMNYDISSLPQSFPDELTSDSCQHGYYNEISDGTCCTIGSCSHNVNADAECKCIYRLYNSIYNKYTAYHLKTCLFTFDSCYGGLGGINGNTTVVLISRSTDTNSKAYMNSIRRIQHEMTHNWGGRHQTETDPCTSKCINNGGFDNVYDYNLTCIWCNRCLTYMDINKF